MSERKHLNHNLITVRFSAVFKILHMTQSSIQTYDSFSNKTHVVAIGNIRQLTHTHLFYRRRFQPQRPLAALFALALAPDDLRAGLAQEGLFVHYGVREGPMHSLRGGKSVHRPPVEAASLPLELRFAAGAALVLRPHGATAAASGRTGRGCNDKFRGSRLLRVSCLIPTRTVHLRAHSRFGELYRQVGLSLSALLGFSEASLHGEYTVNRRCSGGARPLCGSKVSSRGMSIVMLVCL